MYKNVPTQNEVRKRKVLKERANLQTTEAKKKAQGTKVIKKYKGTEKRVKGTERATMIGKSVT